MTFVSLESTDTPINYSDESSAFAYSNEFIQEVVSEINQAIINNNSVSMRIETSSMSYDHTINTKITDCKHSINSIFFNTSEANITVKNPSFGDGMPANGTFKFYVKNDDITITVVIHK